MDVDAIVVCSSSESVLTWTAEVKPCSDPVITPAAVISVAMSDTLVLWCVCDNHFRTGRLGLIFGLGDRARRSCDWTDTCCRAEKI